MSVSPELAPQERELPWPPVNTTELMSYFLAMETKDPESFVGMSDCANELIQKLLAIASPAENAIVDHGNNSASLRLAPEGSAGIGPASEALTYAAYAITVAKMTEAHELPKHNRYHIIYEGFFPIDRGGRKRRVPVAFKEVYTTDDNGNCLSMEWSVRTNYPLREQVERRRLDAELSAASDEDKLIYWGADIQSSVRAKYGETTEPEYPKAA